MHDGVDDGRQPGRGQNQRGSAARGIGGATHGNAAIGLAERRRIVDAVARHRNDVAALLQALDDFVLVLREDPAEAVGALNCGGNVR